MKKFFTKIYNKNKRKISTIFNEFFLRKENILNYDEIS